MLFVLVDLFELLLPVLVIVFRLTLSFSFRPVTVIVGPARATGRKEDSEYVDRKNAVHHDSFLHLLEKEQFLCLNTVLARF